MRHKRRPMIRTVRFARPRRWCVPLDCEWLRLMAMCNEIEAPYWEAVDAAAMRRARRSISGAGK